LPVPVWTTAAPAAFEVTTSEPAAVQSLVVSGATLVPVQLPVPVVSAVVSPDRTGPVVTATAVGTAVVTGATAVVTVVVTGAMAVVVVVVGAAVGAVLVVVAVVVVVVRLGLEPFVAALAKPGARVMLARAARRAPPTMTATAGRVARPWRWDEQVM
jgi:hypothetical protein